MHQFGSTIDIALHGLVPKTTLSVMWLFFLLCSILLNASLVISLLKPVPFCAAASFLCTGPITCIAQYLSQLEFDMEPDYGHLSV
jgi:hypothetical protein